MPPSTLVISSYLNVVYSIDLENNREVPGDMGHRSVVAREVNDKVCISAVFSDSPHSTMSLVKGSYRKRNLDDDEEEDASLPPSNPKPNEEDSSKKRLGGSLAAQAAAKLLKLTEDDSSNNTHSIDIASQLLHRKQEAQASKNISAASATGPRSLLDMLPSPKSSAPKKTAKSQEETSAEEEITPQMDLQKTKTIPATASLSALSTVKSSKKISLSPDVKFDESLLPTEAPPEEIHDAQASTSNSASTNSTPNVGPARPAHLQQSRTDAPTSASVQQVGPARPSYLPRENPAELYLPSDAHYATPAETSYGYSSDFNPSSMDNVVDLSMAQLMAGPVDPSAALASRAVPTSVQAAGVSRTARSKHQITYLAAMAPETERVMKEKNAERARQKAHLDRFR